MDKFTRREQAFRRYLRMKGLAYGESETGKYFVFALRSGIIPTIPDAEKVMSVLRLARLAAFHEEFGEHVDMLGLVALRETLNNDVVYWLPFTLLYGDFAELVDSTPGGWVSLEMWLRENGHNPDTIFSADYQSSLKSGIYRYSPSSGSHIEYVVAFVAKLATALGIPVWTEFNGVELTAQPGQDKQELLQYFLDTLEKEYEAWINSPEYAEQQRKAQEAAERRAALLEGALSVSPERMTLVDEAAWQELLDLNQDPLGRGVLEYAELWARLMEGRMNHGATLEDSAEEASYIADVDGITGYMYGAAVGILAKVWAHGEELRRWHNLRTQIGDEGERANEEGGVLNPALLVIAGDSEDVIPDEEVANDELPSSSNGDS